MHEEWTDRLSEYLDDELSPEERDAVESHLSGCEGCAATLEELQRVVERARALGPRAPHHDLWTGIADRIDAQAAHVAPFRRREPWRVSMTLPQLAAASLLLAAVSGGIVWQLRPSPAGAPGGPGGPVGIAHVLSEPGPAEAVSIEPVGLADAQYDSAVADLQRTLENGRGRLDPATIGILEKNLKIIDGAIDQARRAVMDDPGNSYLTSHLVETRRRKLDLLRRATALASETN